MNRPGLWLRLARAPYVAPAAAPILVGTAYALYDAYELRPVALALTLVGGTALFLGSLVIVAILEITLGREAPMDGDAARAQGPDVIGSGLVGLPEAAAVGASLLGVALACGALLVGPSGSFSMGLGFAGLMIAILYAVPGVGLRDLGHGLPELAAVVGLGLLPCLGGYAAQSGSFTAGAALASLPLGLYGAAIVYAHELRRFHRDPDGASTSIALYLGDEQARLGMWLLPVLAYLAVAVNIVLGEYPRAAWLSLVTAPVLAFKLARLDPSDDTAWVSLVRVTALLSTTTALIIAASIALSGARTP